MCKRPGVIVKSIFSNSLSWIISKQRRLTVKLFSVHVNIILASQALFFPVPLSSLLICALICNLVFKCFRATMSISYPSIKSSKRDFGFINQILKSSVTENPFSRVWSSFGQVIQPLWASVPHLWNGNLKYHLFYLYLASFKKELESTSRRANVKNNKKYKH